MYMFWRVVGILLLGWVAWDLYAGYTLLYDIIYRVDEPVMYWTAVAIWAGLGISCLFSWSE